MKNRLSKNNNLFNEYDKVIKDYLKEDIVQIVPPSEESVTWFHPLFTSQSSHKRKYRNHEGKNSI